MIDRVIRTQFPKEKNGQKIVTDRNYLYIINKNCTAAKFWLENRCKKNEAKTVEGSYRKK